MVTFAIHVTLINKNETVRYVPCPVRHLSVLTEMD